MDRKLKDEYAAELHKHERAIAKILHGYENDWDKVHDLVQDTYAAALASEFNGDSKLVTWVCAIAKHVGAEHVRRMMAKKRGHGVEVLESELPALTVEDRQVSPPYYDRYVDSEYIEQAAATQDPLLILEAEETAAQIRDDLPDTAGQVLALRAEGYAYSEIAETLAISEGYARKVASLAHSRLEEGNISARNATKSVSERDGEPLARAARLSQSDVERAVKDRFERSVSRIEKRRIRMQHPNLTLKGWRDIYA